MGPSQSQGSFNELRWWAMYSDLARLPHLLAESSESCTKCWSGKTCYCYEEDVNHVNLLHKSTITISKMSLNVSEPSEILESQIWFLVSTTCWIPREPSRPYAVRCSLSFLPIPIGSGWWSWVYIALYSSYLMHFGALWRFDFGVRSFPEFSYFFSSHPPIKPCSSTPGTHDFFTG